MPFFFKVLNLCLLALRKGTQLGQFINTINLPPLQPLTTAPYFEQHSCSIKRFQCRGLRGESDLTAVEICTEFQICEKIKKILSFSHCKAKNRVSLLRITKIR